MTSKKLIGMGFTLVEFVKPQYVIDNKLYTIGDIKQHCKLVFIEIEKNKKYGAVARLFERKDLFGRMEETMTKKDRKKMSKALSKIKDDDKPVDTSNWVKPDEESIRNELIKNLFLIEILKEDYWGHGEAVGKAKAYYWLLHGKGPNNPQSFTNYGIDPYFEAIIIEMKGTEEVKRMKISFPNYPKNWLPRQNIKIVRAMYQKWKEQCLKNMIILED